MDKPGHYQHIIAEATSFLSHYIPQVSQMSSMSIVSAVLKMNFPRWVFVGFYVIREVDGTDILEIGPYQGNLLACARIEIGNGVCGTAVERKETVIVDDVAQSSNYISCDPHTKSEIVVPVMLHHKVVGVLDIDSEEIGGFDDQDKYWLEKIVHLIPKE